ncbi:MAG: hypothetical protein ACI9JM_001883 [Halioglobus sp.]|jgi:hypothetical protein
MTINNSEEAEQSDDQATQKLNPMQVIGSVFAAGLGVQSSKNRERDFKQGRFGVFVGAGLVFTLLFIGAVFTVVQVVLQNAGK